MLIFTPAPHHTPQAARHCTAPRALLPLITRDRPQRKTASEKWRSTRSVGRTVGLMIKNSTLSKDVVTWITSAPNAALDALITASEHRQVLDAAYAERTARTGVELPIRTADPITAILIAIRGADARIRTAAKRPLATINDYRDYRLPGDPGISAIYNHFGTWPYALLAAQAPSHVDSARRRKRGGSRAKGEFPQEKAERAMLACAETLAGRLPTAPEYVDFLLNRPDMPSKDQMLGRRANRKASRKWSDLQRAASRRALASNDWPLTRDRLMLEGLTA